MLLLDKKYFLNTVQLLNNSFWIILLNIIHILNTFNSLNTLFAYYKINLTQTQIHPSDFPTQICRRSASMCYITRLCFYHGLLPWYLYCIYPGDGNSQQ